MYTCLTVCQQCITHREESNNETYILGIRKQVHVLTDFAGNNYRKQCENRREGESVRRRLEMGKIMTTRGNRNVCWKICFYFILQIRLLNTILPMCVTEVCECVCIMCEWACVMGNIYVRPVCVCVWQMRRNGRISDDEKRARHPACKCVCLCMSVCQSRGQTLANANSNNISVC